MPGGGLGPLEDLAGGAGEVAEVHAVEFVAEGYLARAIQHEVDHLDGVLFIDRLSMLKRRFLRDQLEAIARGELPGDAHPPATRTVT